MKKGHGMPDVSKKFNPFPHQPKVIPKNKPGSSTSHGMKAGFGETKAGKKG